MNFRKMVVNFSLYVILVFGAIYFFSMAIKFSIDVYLWAFTLVLLLYFPSMLIIGSLNKGKTKEEREQVWVGNDIAHFREVVKKALDGNAVAQRDIEMRILNVAAVDLHIRYGISEKALRTKLGDAEFLERYLGHAGVTLAKMFERRHELKLSVPGEQFKKEIEEIMEAIR